MLRDNKIWVANTENGENVFLLPRMANRHGLIAGATGTGKTITLKVLAESFSDMGVPVFLADVKGDLSGIAVAGETEGACAHPSNFWDVYGEKGSDSPGTAARSRCGSSASVGPPHPVACPQTGSLPGDTPPEPTPF